MLRVKKSFFCLRYGAKSERVNAIRKQYDAFLEEDKKRKERNEYILGRLDNMRYNSTALQVRHKSIVFGDLLPTYNRVVLKPDPFERHSVPNTSPTHQISHALNHNLQLDIPRKPFDETSLLLKEITKKYILIPKLRPSLTDDYIRTVGPQSLPVSLSTPQANNTPKEDWKSKYDILDQLKKNEKEEQINKYGKVDILPEKEGQIPNNNYARDIKVDNDNILGIDQYNKQKPIEGYNLESYSTEYPMKHEHEAPEKDSNANTVKVDRGPHETTKVSDNKEQEPHTEHDTKSSAAEYPIISAAYENPLQNENLEPKMQIDETVLNTDATDYQYCPEDNTTASIKSNNTDRIAQVYNDDNQANEIPQQEAYATEYELHGVNEGAYPRIGAIAHSENPAHIFAENVENIYPTNYENVPNENPENAYLGPNNYPVQGPNTTEIVEETSGIEPKLTETHEDIQEYPIEMIVTQDFTPNENVVLKDGVNVNPHYLASDTKPRVEYETNPEYDINAEYEIDSQNTGAEIVEVPVDNSGIEEFDQEQSEMFYSEQPQEFDYEQQVTADYSNPESYPQTQEYVYHEGAAVQEQEYPVELNETEETSSRYDQNYEQQYTAQYDQQEYDQTQAQQPQHDAVEGYDQTQQQYQDYEYPQVEDNDTVESVAQELDNEQGYVEQYDVNQGNEIRGVQEAT